MDFAVYRLDELQGAPVGGQVLKVLQDVKNRSGADWDPVEVFAMLDDRVKSDRCFVLVGVRPSKPEDFCCLFTVEEWQTWLGKRFAQVTLGWSDSTITREEAAVICDRIEGFAKALGVNRVQFNTKRDALAMERWAKKHGYRRQCVVFEKEVEV